MLGEVRSEFPTKLEQYLALKDFLVLLKNSFTFFLNLGLFLTVEKVFKKSISVFNVIYHRVIWSDI